MDFNDLHTQAVKDCGQSEIMLNQIMINDVQERRGLVDFSQDSFVTCKERGIVIYMPYYDAKNPVHVKYANLYGLIIANHRSEIHVEDRSDEIEEYSEIVLSEFENGVEMVEMSTERWWRG